MINQKERGPWHFSFRHNGTEYNASFVSPADRRDGVEEVTVFGVNEAAADLQEAAEQAATDWVEDARRESRHNYGNY